MRTARLLLAALLAAGCGAPGERRPDVLLVTVDTLRADRLGVYGYDRGTSPELDRFAAGAVVFEAAQAQTSWTLGSLASLITARWVSDLGIRDFRSRLAADETTLAEVLAAAGYRTGAVGTHVVFQEKYGLVQGIPEPDEELVRASFEESHRAVTSERVSDAALAWIAARSRDAAPWFLWLHYFDPHIPYLRHPGFTERFGDGGSERYDGEVAFTDFHLGRVLRAAAAGDRPLVAAVTSDHGEEFLDHGGREHGHTLYQELVRAPLLVSAPGFAPARVPERVRLVDLAPTLCELAGLPGALRGRGRSLVPLMRGEGEAGERPCLAELALREPTAADALVLGRWKVVVPRSGGAPELYDLERDPRELRDLAPTSPERVAELAALLEAQRGAPRTAPSPLELDEEELRVLSDLGYLGDD